MTIQEKLQVLKEKVFTPEYDNESKKRIMEIGKRLKEADVKMELFKQDGIKMLIEFLIDNNKKINHALLIMQEITEEERMILFAKREWNREFLKFFKGAEIELKTIDLEISQELDEEDINNVDISPV